MHPSMGPPHHPGGLISPNQPPAPPPPPPQQPNPGAHQTYPPMGAANSPQYNIQQQVWTDKPFPKMAGYPSPQQQVPPPPPSPQQQPNRMHLSRAPMNQGPQPPPPPPPGRHMQPGMYPQPGNRVILQQQQMTQQMPSGAGMMRPGGPGGHCGGDPNDPYGEMSQKHNLVKRLQFLETEVTKLRKMKKSLTAKQRQCRKNQTELADHDKAELARITQEQSALQKQLDQARKMVRQSGIVLSDKMKTGQTGVNLPHSPSTQASVNSPLAVGLNTGGGGMPLGICPSTPQSPSLTSASPSSSLMQNSPISGMHSPASMLSPNPMPTNSDIRPPQIVQDDNNPFSDVYLQKEKKQQQQQQGAAMYGNAHPPPSKELMNTGRMYPGNHDFQTLPQYSMGGGNIRTQAMNFNSNTNANQYRFNQQQPPPPPAQTQQQHFPSQPMQPNYQQQIPRPPPPPYPGKTQQQPPPQHYGGPRGPGSGPGSAYSPQPMSQQQSQRSQMECGMSSMQHYGVAPENVPGTMIPPNDPTGFGGIVGHTHTTLEFVINDEGTEHPNESDPFTFLKEKGDSTATQAQPQRFPSQPVQQQIPRPPPPPYSGKTQQQSPPPGPDTDPDSTNSPSQQQSQESQIEHDMSTMPVYEMTIESVPDTMISLNDFTGLDGTVGQTHTTLMFVINDEGIEYPNESDPFSSLEEMGDAAKANGGDDGSGGDSGEADGESTEEAAITVASTDVTPMETENANVNENGSENQPPPTAAAAAAAALATAISLSEDAVETINSTAPPPLENTNENSNLDAADDGSRSYESSQIRQNALLKKLLQNCPSADHLKMLSESQNNKVGAGTVPATTENDCHEPVPSVASTVEVTTVEPAPIAAETSTTSAIPAPAAVVPPPVTEEIPDAAVIDTVPAENETPPPVITVVQAETSDNQSASCTVAAATAVVAEAATAATPPPPPPPVVVEKKLSYLDIRRAQLEREPTPPLEDIKPKRKRAIKRKECSKSTDGDGSMDPNGGGASAGVAPGVSVTANAVGVSGVAGVVNSNVGNSTTKSNKKRARKGSQTKNEEMDTVCNNEKMFNTIMNNFRTFPAVEILEPEVKLNMNVCLPPDAVDFNLKNCQLKGCYGNAFLASQIDYYSTYPFGPNKAPSIMTPSGANSFAMNSKVGFYHEEFGRSILDLKETEATVDECVSLYCRDINSPESVVSGSLENVFDGDSYYIDDEYNRMKYINQNSCEEDGRKSPFLTLHPIPVHPSATREYQENNKENFDENNKSKTIKQQQVDLSALFKETGNVGVTIIINDSAEIKNVMLTLAKILNLKSSFSYNVEMSSNSDKVTEVVEIGPEEKSKETFCKFCDCSIKEKDQGFKAELKFDEHYFCNKECFKNYTLTNVNMTSAKNEKTQDVLMDYECQNHIGTENELVSIFNHSESGTDDLESDISVQERHWKNTRYLNWNHNTFKNESKPLERPKVEQESVEEMLGKLEMCLRPVANAVEQRRCIFCHELGDGNIDGPSRLLNMDVDKWVHLNCALWSYEVYEMLNGALMNVDQAYKRSMNSLCVSCSKFGASIKCFKFRCNNSYHFPCAIREKCVFYTDKTLLCPTHSAKIVVPNAEEMNSFVVTRRVYINRDEQKQIAAMLHHGDNNLMRIGSLIFLNIGQLLPHQLQSFHTQSYIYPIGYKVSRFYWSSRRVGKRCQYICSIDELEGRPQFSIEIHEEGFENVTYQASTPKLAWQKIIESIVELRENSQTIKVFFDFISGEDLFGLNEPAIIRILESLPGVDTLYDYSFKYGRSPWYELPLAINPSGCARSEPRKRFHFKRPHTLHVSSNASSRSSLQSHFTNSSESSSPYVKQFVHSKVSQYRKMKQEWRSNVSLGRSRIQGLGLYACRDIEKHTMIIEYIGLIIRNTIADRNERIHEAHNRGVYMFRLDDNRVIDATISGGLARYVNHSCDPNCVAECVQIDRENKILIIANRRIQKGEELTYDYKFDVEDDQHKIPCLCGAANCRKWMN